MTILITGATGFIGSYLVRRLLEDGHEITVLVRDTERAAQPLGNDVRYVSVDEADSVLEMHVARCSAVIDLAGEPLFGDHQRNGSPSSHEQCLFGFRQM